MGKIIRAIIIAVVCFTVVAVGYLYIQGNKREKEDKAQMYRQIEQILNKPNNNGSKNEADSQVDKMRTAVNKLNASMADAYASEPTFNVSVEKIVAKLNQAGITEKNYTLTTSSGEKVVKHDLLFPTSDMTSPIYISLFQPIEKSDTLTAVLYGYNPMDKNKQEIMTTLSQAIFNSKDALKIMEKQQQETESLLKKDSFSDVSKEFNGFIIRTSGLQSLNTYTLSITKKPI